VADRLDDDRRDLLGVAVEDSAHVVEVVEAAHLGRVDRRLEHAGRPRVAAPHAIRRGQPVAQDVVVEAVVTALELDDLLPPGDAAGQADRVVGRLRTAVADNDLLGAQDVLDDLARERDLGLRDADAEQHALLDRRGDPPGHRGVRVPEEDRAVGGVVVDVAAALEVPQVRAGAAGEAQPRVAAAAAGVHTTGNDLARLLEQVGRRGRQLGGRHTGSSPNGIIGRDQIT
jgi:hypothetical protein